jgi:hypothetical protein
MADRRRGGFSFSAARPTCRSSRTAAKSTRRLRSARGLNQSHSAYC